MEVRMNCGNLRWLPCSCPRGCLRRARGSPNCLPDAVNMRWQIGVSQKIPTPVDLEILAQDLIPVKPAGVSLDIKVTTVDNAPLFGWGISNEFIGGWGQGAWGASPSYVAQNIA